MIIKSIVSATCCVLAVVAFNANAELVDNGTVTFDSSTGLEWLDLTETAGLSYNYVKTQLASGGLFEGWAYASLAQVDGLFDSAGGTGPYNGWSTDNNGVVAPLLELWGDISLSSNNYSYFITPDTNPDNKPVYGLAYDDYVMENAATQDYLKSFYLYWVADAEHPEVGSALVRAAVVPLAPAAWLFSSGLLFIFGLAKRKVRS